ncbi:unnamed protein product, partial [Urochloa humidicola]
FASSSGGGASGRASAISLSSSSSRGWRGGVERGWRGGVERRCVLCGGSSGAAAVRVSLALAVRPLGQSGATGGVDRQAGAASWGWREGLGGRRAVPDLQFLIPNDTAWLMWILQALQLRLRAPQTQHLVLKRQYQK